jgi:hypothetical protein
VSRDLRRDLAVGHVGEAHARDFSDSWHLPTPLTRGALRKSYAVCLRGSCRSHHEMACARPRTPSLM